MSPGPVLAAVELPLAAAEPVVAFAAGLARLSGAGLVLLHVAAPDSDVAPLEAGPPSVRESRGQELRAEHRELLERAEALRAGGIDAHAHLLPGVVSDTVLAQAERHAAGLIVLGTHRHGALYRAVLGTSTDSILRRARVPVVVVPG